MWQPPVAGLRARSPWTVRCILGTVLVVGCLLRVWYASVGLDKSRFWDEGYSLENVRAIMVEGTIEPTRGFYPSPVFNLPAAAAVAGGQTLFEWTGNDRLQTFDGHRYHRGAFFLLRLQQTFYSLAAVVLTFLIGRRLFSQDAGLLAAAIVCGTPWHVQAAAVFKPDSLLSFTTLLAFWLSLRLVERPTTARALATGLAIALAMSAKMTGGLIAIPLTVALTMGARYERRRLGTLAVTGAASALFFVALNPYWRRYPTYLSNLSHDYAMRAGWEGWERREIPGKALEFLVGPQALGWAVGSVCLAGFVALAFAVLRPTGLSWHRRAQMAMLVSFPVAYVTAYSLRTAYFKQNNFLPLVPLLAVVGAHLAVTGWRWLGGRVAAAGSDRLRPPVLALTSGLLLAPATLFVYGAMVPSTLYAAEKFLVGESRLKPRLLLEEEGLTVPPWRRSIEHLARVVVPRIADVPKARLNRADGEIFLESRLRGADAEFYEARLAGVGERHREVLRPALFELRGPTVVALRHIRRELESGRRLAFGRCGDTCWRISAGALEAQDELASFALSVPNILRAGQGSVPVLSLGGREVPLRWVRARGGFALYHSERVVVPAEVDLELEVGVPDERVPGLMLHLWKRPGRTRGPSHLDRDEVGVGEVVESGQIDDREDDESGDDQGQGQHQAAVAEQ